jgi:hypothetical protein
MAACREPPCIAPEGTRSATGLVAPDLKKGPFHLRSDWNQKAKILCMVVQGAFELWSPRRMVARMGKVRIWFMPETDCCMSALTNEEDKNATRQKIRLRMQQGVAEDRDDHPIEELENCNRKMIMGDKLRVEIEIQKF